MYPTQPPTTQSEVPKLALDSSCSPLSAFQNPHTDSPIQHPATKKKNLALVTRQEFEEEQNQKFSG